MIYRVLVEFSREFLEVKEKQINIEIKSKPIRDEVNKKIIKIVSRHFGVSSKSSSNKIRL